jgi:subtilisin family serine protease
VDGTGVAVAVIDTGIRPTHLMFRGAAGTGSRILKERNFTRENGGWADDSWDTHGHGTHVSGLVAGSEVPVDAYTAGGVAPKSGIVSIKILDSTGSGDLQLLATSLAWLRGWNSDQEKLGNSQLVSVLNLSLGDIGNYTRPRDAERRNHLYQRISREIDRLVSQNVVVVCAAGNAYYRFLRSGTAFPAIHERVTSVGAVFDSDMGLLQHPSGSWWANPADRNKIAPYSQRLNTYLSDTPTSVFAPGTSLVSAGHTSDNALAVLQGTSQAAPIVSGAALLLQQYWKREKGVLPWPSQVRSWLKAGVMTRDDENDSVPNTGLDYPTLNIKASLDAADAAAREL